MQEGGTLAEGVNSQLVRTLLGRSLPDHLNMHASNYLDLYFEQLVYITGSPSTSNRPPTVTASSTPTKDDHTKKQPRKPVKLALHATGNISALFPYDQMLVVACCSIPKSTSNSILCLLASYKHHCLFLNYLLKIALCQLSVTIDKERNTAHARNAIQEASGKGAKLVLPPEQANSNATNRGQRKFTRRSGRTHHPSLKYTSSEIKGCRVLGFRVAG